MSVSSIQTECENNQKKDIFITYLQKQPLVVLCKKRCSAQRNSKNFAKFSGKHLCQRIFFDKVEKFLRTPFLVEHLPATASLPLHYNRSTSFEMNFHLIA